MDERFEILKRYNWWGEALPEEGTLRSDYLTQAESYDGSRLVKVLVGQRRAGKSFILRQIVAKLIRRGVERHNIFFVNCEMLDFGFLRDYSDLAELFRLYLAEFSPEGRVYIFIDEIQNIDGWERFVNSYSQDYTADYDIYITGSNSKLLSGELATFLSGRYVSMEVFPFSYQEYLTSRSLESGRASYIKYLEDSGLPELTNLPDEKARQNYISAVKDTVLLRDIIQRHNIKDPHLLEDLFIYLVCNASKLTSLGGMANYFKSKGRKTSYDTVANYVGYLQDAFLLHRVDRYNISGKEIVAGNAKYYANDTCFRNYLFASFAYGIGYQLENVVYLELRRAGYSVFTGNVGAKEVDFVAQKADRIIYIQVTYILLDESTIEREYASLEAVRDNYEKVVVSLDDVPLPLRGGIRHVQAWKLSEIL